jgi:hypothetical protein
MKKILESNLGIWLISIIPTFISYIITFKQLQMKIDLLQHAPFIIAISVMLICILFLYIRKWALNRFRALNLLIEQNSDAIYTIEKYDIAKNNEQFTKFYQAIKKMSGGKILVPKVKMSEAEKILFKRLAKYEEEKLEEIFRLMNEDFKSDEQEKNE